MDFFMTSSRCIPFLCFAIVSQCDKMLFVLIFFLSIFQEDALSFSASQSYIQTTLFGRIKTVFSIDEKKKNPLHIHTLSRLRTLYFFSLFLWPSDMCVSVFFLSSYLYFFFPRNLKKMDGKGILQFIQ